MKNFLRRSEEYLFISTINYVLCDNIATENNRGSVKDEASSLFNLPSIKICKQHLHGNHWFCKKSHIYHLRISFYQNLSNDIPPGQ